MKFSESMLKGFRKLGGKQLNNGQLYDNADNPRAACAMGAAFLGGWQYMTTSDEFFEVWGMGVHELNDDEKLPWEHIYGMAVAAGL